MGSFFVSADGCFGLPRKKSSSESHRQALTGEMYFEDQTSVDRYIEAYPKATTGGLSKATFYFCINII